MSDPSPFCLDFLREFERLHLRVYLDAVGIPTIGYGHVLKGEERSTTEISAERAEELLFSDASLAREAVLHNMSTVVLHPYEIDALTSFVFNVGVEAWYSSTLHACVLAGDHVAAAHQFRRWHHAGGRDFAGLLRRRVAEELWFLGGHIDSVMNIAKGVWTP